ncbi:response regulator [Flavobacterium sp. WC2509]|uniref:response regulator n=1 Tax=Flavobacterium sp. WC2509 TaxID=3461406 RepID=UPI004043BA40
METKYTFLLIEDNRIDQFIGKKMLENLNCASEINISNNGKEGLEWLCRNRKEINEPLIILLDIQMPIMNGTQFLVEYDKLEDELKRKTQIFILSSSLDDDEIERLKNNVHVTEFLSKPLICSDLEGVVLGGIELKIK